MADINRGLRRAARALLPPVVTNWLRPSAAPISFTGAFGSYADAAQAAGSSGYEDPASVSRTLTATAEDRARIIAAPTVALQPRVMQVLAAFLLAIDRPRSQPVRVLDFGGGVGLHFFSLLPFLSKRWSLDSTVCELPALASAGAYGGQIRFVSALDQLREQRFDIGLASGSLQYVPEPRLTCEALLARCDSLVINRAPFVASAADQLTVQQVRFDERLVRYPAWFLSRDGWFSHIERRGFRIELTWPAPDDRVVLDEQGIDYSGLLARRNV